MNGVWEFEAVVACVEERFRRGYDREKVGTAKSESQMDYERASIGWWLVLAGTGMAICVGEEKPDIEVGDRMRVLLYKKGAAAFATAPVASS